MFHCNCNDYLKLEGNFIPPEAEKFSGDGEYCDHCVLCYPGVLTKHEEHHLLEFPDGRQLYICEDCAYDVEIMNYTNVMSNRSSEAENRLVDYMVSGYLPKDAEQYLGSPGICIFCKYEISVANYNQVLHLQVPVNKSGIGGVVHVCPECAESCNYASRLHWRQEDSCHACGLDYPISLDEMTYRRDIRNSVGKHMCASCFEQEYGFFSRERFEYEACNCEEASSILVDLTLKGPKWDHNPRHCSSCAPTKPQFGKDNTEAIRSMVEAVNENSYPNDDDSITVTLTSLISLTFYPIGKKSYSFEVKMARSPGSKFTRVVDSSKDSHFPIGDAAVYAYNAALPFIENQKQLNL